MMIGEATRDSRIQTDVSSPSEIPALTTMGNYTYYPLEYCSEDQAAQLFSKICQRGNPLLQGRPDADLQLLGRAMYRKSNILRLGEVVVHEGVPVALGFNWDVAEGGVWHGSGLEMPASLAAHAAIGRATFESLKARGRTFFSAFYGVVVPHKVALGGYLGASGLAAAHLLGFKDVFMFTPLPTLQGREGLYSRKENEFERHWGFQFADVRTDSEAVSTELKELNGCISCTLVDANHCIGDEYMKATAAMARMKTADEIRKPAMLMAQNHVRWLKQIHSTNWIASRL
jgi:hypothetical protein